MTLRTLEDLEAHITGDLKWRLVELDNWESMTASCRPHQQSGALRAGTALLYAHWEGYIKEAARSYLEYISKKGLNIAQLRNEIAAIALRGMLGKGIQSKSPKKHTAIIELLREETSHKANIPYSRSTIRTNSNLSFEVFEDIMHSIGCNSDRHEIHRSLINARLLKNRNEIAHGKELLISFEDWLTLRERVVQILQDVRDQLNNAAALEAFRRA